MRNVPRIAVAGAAVLVVSGLLGAPAVAEPSTAGRYAVDPDAEPVEGAATSGDGPQLKPGTYRDTIDRDARQYYAVNLDDATSAHLSVTAAPPPGKEVKKYGEGLELALTTVDGDQCGGSLLPRSVDFSGSGTPHPLTGTVSRLIGVEDQCQEAGPYLLSVQRKDNKAADPTSWPLEIHYMAEPGIKGEPPAGADTGDATETPVPKVTGAPRSARGGLGFAAARSVDEGVWKGRVRPGETRYYRVPLDWGQRLNAGVELAGVQTSEQFPDMILEGVGMQLFNPAREQLDEPSYELYRAESAAVRQQSATVTYANRFADQPNAAQVAGWYYVAVTLSPELTEYFGKRAAPITLRVEVGGHSVAGPRYRTDPHDSGFGVDDGDREQASKAQTDDQVGAGRDLSLLGYGGVGVGVLLLVVLGCWYALGRRRAARATAPAGAGVGRVAGAGGVPGTGAPYGMSVGYPAAGAGGGTPGGPVGGPQGGPYGSPSGPYPPQGG